MSEEYLSFLPCSVCISAFIVGILTGHYGYGTLDAVFFALISCPIMTVIIWILFIWVSGKFLSDMDSSKTIAWVACILIAIGAFVFGLWFTSKDDHAYCSECGVEMEGDEMLCPKCYFKEEQFEKLRALLKDDYIGEDVMVEVLWDAYSQEIFIDKLEDQGYKVFELAEDMLEYLFDAGYVQRIEYD